MQLSQRKQMVLAAIVEIYIETGEPVSSKALMDSLDMSVSSATIRNDMLSLSNDDYLSQPHTSAGRIPTPKGFRYYIDNLMKNRRLTESEKKKIREMLPQKLDSADELLEDASEALANLTGCASIFTTPKDDEAIIKRIDLIPVGRYTCLLLLQTSTGLIKNRMCRLDCELTVNLINIFQNVVSKHFKGIAISDVSLALVQTITASLGEHALLMSPLLVAICDIVRDAAESHLKVDGESNLWSHGEYGQGLQKLLSFLSRKDLIHNLVNEMSNSSADKKKKGLTILIGKESPYEELENSSMILSDYNIGDKSVGSIGIIGPIRIDYSQLVPSMEYLTDIVGNLLSELFEKE